VLIIGLFWGAESVVPKEQFSWLSRAAVLALCVFVVAMLFRDIPYTLMYFGDMFRNMSALVSGFSRRIQILWMIFIVGYFYLAINLPVVWFWFTILVFTPAGFTYDRYRTMLERKANKEGSQSTSQYTA